MVAYGPKAFLNKDALLQYLFSRYPKVKKPTKLEEVSSIELGVGNV